MERKEHCFDLSENTIAFEKEEVQLYEYFHFVADKWQDFLRIDKFLANRITGASRNRIQQASEAGFIIVNNYPVKSNYKVKPEDVISVKMNHPCRKSVILPENIPFGKVYEDEDVMVIDKPAGLVVHPGHGNYNGTLINAIAWHYSSTDHFFEAFVGCEDFRFGLVHRIDRDTSGLLVIAKNPKAKTHLEKQFLYKTTQRAYLTLVWGNVRENEGMIEVNIGRNLKDRLRMSVFPNGKEGKPAITYYKVLERFGYVTLLECKLETGRTHQIRVHMKHIGHTVFNDTRYGGNKILKGNCHTKYKQFVQNCFELCPRQALHAKTLGFVHPKTEKNICLETPVPNDMMRLIDKWRSFTT